MKMNDKTTFLARCFCFIAVSIVIQRSILGINNSVYSVVYYSHGLGACVCVCVCACVRVSACAYLCVRVHSFDE